jgi:hypothetical protein
MLPGYLTVFTSIMSTYGVPTPQAEAKWTGAISPFTISYFVTLNAYGLTNAPQLMGGATVVTMYIGGVLVNRIIANTESGVNRTESITVPANTVLTVNILSVGNSSGYVSFSKQ